MANVNGGLIMLYTAEISNVGDNLYFTAPTKKILTEKIVNYFRENEDETCKIVSIWCEFNDGSVRWFCDLAIQKIQEIVDNDIAKARKLNKLKKVSTSFIEGPDPRLFNHIKII